MDRKEYWVVLKDVTGQSAMMELDELTFYLNDKGVVLENFSFVVVMFGKNFKVFRRSTFSAKQF